MNLYRIASPTDLQHLLPLFSQSYGEPVALQDELEYFTTQQPPHWYYAASSPGAPVAFLRYFPVGGTALQELEYWGPEEAALPLLDHLLQQAPAIPFRWKSPSPPLFTPKKLKARGFVVHAVYGRLVSPPTVLSAPSSQVRFANATDLLAVQPILTQAFGSISLEQLRQYHTDQRLTVVLTPTGAPVGACLTNAQTTTRELVQIAIDPTYRGQGYGHLLLTQSLHLHQQQQSNLSFWLRVRMDNEVALALYNKVGFRQTAVETWWVRE